MKKIHCVGLCLSFLLASQLVGVATRVDAQKADVATANNACTNAERGKFTVQCKDRYFLGETPTITLSITNTGRSPQRVKEAEHQKFSLEMRGKFSNDSGEDEKKVVWDGSWIIPKPLSAEPKPDQVVVFGSPGKREPKYVALAPGESTNLTLDLPKTFGSRLGVSKYKLMVKSEDGQTVVKEFEVYFDDEKSVPVLGKMLESEDEGERYWAGSNLAHFNRTRLIALLEALIKSGTEKQREFASRMLAETKAGWFDSLKLKVEGKDRFRVGENPVIGISIQNGATTPKTVRDAGEQKFLLELKRVSANDAKQESKTCVYTPKDSPQKPKLVTLGEFQSTTLILNLSECFGVRLDAGKYELIVKAADQEQIKEQTAIKKFEVF